MRGKRREREQGRSERGRADRDVTEEGIRGVALSSDAGRQPGGVAVARACAVSLLCLLAEVEDDWHQASGLGRAGGGAGPAGLHGEARYFFSLSFFFCSVFF